MVVVENAIATTTDARECEGVSVPTPGAVAPHDEATPRTHSINSPVKLPRLAGMVPLRKLFESPLQQPHK